VTCTCGRIKVGWEVTQLRNCNPDCEEHGVGTAWYTEPERVAKRQRDNERLIDLQLRAREARRQARKSKEES